jgi:hypothetical protein
MLQHCVVQGPKYQAQAHPRLHDFVLAHSVRAEAHKRSGVAGELSRGRRVTYTGHLIASAVIATG